jgi:hypothetical protein
VPGTVAQPSGPQEHWDLRVVVARKEPVPALGKRTISTWTCKDLA